MVLQSGLDQVGRASAPAATCWLEYPRWVLIHKVLFQNGSNRPGRVSLSRALIAKGRESKPHPGSLTPVLVPCLSVLLWLQQALAQAQSQVFKGLDVSAVVPYFEVTLDLPQKLQIQSRIPICHSPSFH